MNKHAHTGRLAWIMAIGDYASVLVRQVDNQVMVVCKSRDGQRRVGVAAPSVDEALERMSAVVEAQLRAYGPD